MTGLELALAIIGVVVTIVGGVVTLMLRRAKDIQMLEDRHRKELQAMVETRGERIADLESHIARLEGRIAKLEGAYDALQRFKVNEIADAVVAKLIGEDFDPA